VAKFNPLFGTIPYKTAAKQSRRIARSAVWAFFEMGNSVYLSVYLPTRNSFARWAQIPFESSKESNKTTRETLQNRSNCKPLENISVHCGDID